MYPYTEVTFRDGAFDVIFYTVEGLWTKQLKFDASDTRLMVERIAEWCTPTATV